MIDDLIKKMENLKNETNGDIDKLINELKEVKYSQCTHKDKDGNPTLEYCNINEMRSWDMYCTQCGKRGTRKELEGGIHEDRP